MKKDDYFREIIRMMREYWKIKKEDMTYEEMKDNYNFMKHELKFVKKFAISEEEE